MSHSTLLVAAQILKIVAGVAQLGFGVWLVFRPPRSWTRATFGISFAANGIAYALFNLGMPGQRALESLPVLGRAFFNWIATISMLLFAALLIRGSQRWKLAALTGMSVGGLVLAGDLFARRLSLMQFGGIAIYPATALVLGALPIVYLDESATAQSSVWLGAALAINSVDHLGAGITNVSTGWLLQVAAMVVVFILWIIAGFMRNDRNWTPVLLVGACLTLPFLSGVLVTAVAGSYVGMQRSGLIGAGRLVTTGLLAYAVVRRQAFSAAPQRERTVSA